MNNKKLLARAEKAEKELAECRVQIKELIGHLIRQQDQSVKAMKELLGNTKRLEDQIIRDAAKDDL